MRLLQSDSGFRLGILVRKYVQRERREPRIEINSMVNITSQYSYGIMNSRGGH